MTMFEYLLFRSIFFLSLIHGWAHMYMLSMIGKLVMTHIERKKRNITVYQCFHATCNL